MTSNDKQIDLLMKRYAQATPAMPATGHLDADELSAFAEGALPAATRARYVSHLADCDNCRKQASAVAISSGAVAPGEPTVTETKTHHSFWQVLAGLFALPVLRYAAFGAVVLIVAGIAFVALRRSANREAGQLLARNNESARQEVPNAVKPPADSSGAGAANREANSNLRPTTPPADAPASTVTTSKRAEVGAREDTAAAPMVAKDAPPPAPVVAEKKAPPTDVAKSLPSYAPVPPGEPAATQAKQQDYREQQAGAGISGPRQQQKIDSADKLAQDRDREAAKETGRADDNARKAGVLGATAQAQTASRRGVDEKAKGPMRNMENNTLNRNESANRAEPPKTANKPEADERAATEESETRSAGGRKFRRQGRAWIDQKFKSSMSLKTISRGSEEFADLDSGLRSIAQQLSGEVIVVWKGKAYRIK